ncbi:MAG: DUF262 domain-containing protein [Sulfuricurvum sp.]
MNYWILIAAPDKWFCESCDTNANVNEILLTLDEQPWKVRQDYFQDAKIGDKVVIKISQDKRSIERRTLNNGEVVDVLQSGLYAIGEISKELYFDEEDNCHRVDVKIINNLFKDNQIVDAEMAEKILGSDFISQSSKKIDEKKYAHLLSIVEITQNNNDDEIEPKENLEPNSSDENTTIYPAEVKIQRDMYSVRELLTELKDERLVLAPDFQREFVWSLKQKSELVESILMGIPLPMIYFFEGDDGVIQVVDGKQRLTSLFEFMENKFPLSQSLSILTDLRGKKYNDLTPSERTKIARHQFVTQTIIPPTPDKIKFDIFERVNRKGSTLNNQEMRNALYQGHSTRLLDDLAKYDSFLKATDEGISPMRMKDRYMILRFLAFYLWKKGISKDKEGKTVEYRSDIDDFLGKTMSFINRQDENFILDVSKMFNETMILAFDSKGENIFRIPSKERKRPINMALMETLGYLFSQIRDKKDPTMYQKSIDTLLEDRAYIEALTQRVDSTNSVETRFKKIDNILKGIA